MSGFCGAGQASSGSVGHSKPPDLQTFGRSQSPLTFPFPTHTTMKQSVWSGRTLTVCWSNCGAHVRSARCLRLRVGQEKMRRSCYRDSRAWGPSRYDSKRQWEAAPATLSGDQYVTSSPVKIIDLIFHRVHDEPTTLRACCLVFKSWVPPTRRYLFARVDFRSFGSVKLWMTAFQNPSNSLSHYTRVLRLSNLETVNAAVSDVRSWVQSSNCIVELHVETLGRSITEFPSLDCTDRRLPLHSSTLLTPLSRSHKSSTSPAPFPFSKISHCAPLSTPSLSPTSGILLRPRRDSPGPFP